jgi:hypothetical protein
MLGELADFTFVAPMWSAKFLATIHLLERLGADFFCRASPIMVKGDKSNE